MNWTKLAVADVLIGFGALSAYAVYQHGFVGVFEALLANPATVTALCDLSIALGLVSLWVIRDARAHGVSPAPYLLLTLVAGSVGPLLYLLRRPSETTETARLAVRTA